MTLVMSKPQTGISCVQFKLSPDDSPFYETFMNGHTEGTFLTKKQTNKQTNKKIRSVFKSACEMTQNNVIYVKWSRGPDSDFSTLCSSLAQTCLFSSQTGRWIELQGF